MRWTVPMVALGLLAMVFAGCLRASGPGLGSTDARVAVTWTNPGDPNSTTWRKVWEVESVGWAQGGEVAVLDTVGASIEGWDVQFTLRMRPSEPGTSNLTYADALDRPGEFTFSYRERGYWAGRTIDRVVDVREDRSWVRFSAPDVGSGPFTVGFALLFDGACAHDDRCDRPEEGTHTTRLWNGEYPTDEEHPRRLD